MLSGLALVQLVNNVPLFPHSFSVVALLYLARVMQQLIGKV